MLAGWKWDVACDWGWESGSARPINGSIPPLGWLMSLGLTQTCSARSLHTISARWFVCSRLIGERGRNRERKRGKKCRRQDADRSGRPYARLSPTVNSICTSSDAHPYVWAVCVCVCVCIGLNVFLSSFYRGIQHQHSGETASHHRLCGSRLGLPHRRGRHHHRLQSVSQSRSLPLSHSRLHQRRS